MEKKKRILITSHWRGNQRAVEMTTGQWELEPILPDQDVRCLEANQCRPGNLYAGTQGNGVLRSDDYGKTWQVAGLEGKVVKSLASSQFEPDTLYAGSKPAAIYVSRDGGGNWIELESFQNIPGRWFWMSPAERPFKAYVQSIGLSPEDPHVIVAGIEAGAVVRSVDGGVTWSGHLKGTVRDCHSLTFHYSDGDWVYEAGGGGAAFSRDGGASWTQPRKGLDRRYGWACAADPGKPEVWYVSASPSFSWKHFQPTGHVDGQADTYIFRKVGGAGWEKLAGGLPQPLDYMAYALVTDPGNSGHLYAGLSSGDVWFSVDFGDTWEKLPLNLVGINNMLLTRQVA
jgi:hypothetical protein